VLNYLFMKPLGLPGIALSTSVVYVVSFLYLRISLSRALRKEEVRADALSEIAEAATA
jgi:peptidoglycan biosynthesis protein MviN/MurJ (putative lipid II flippase)